MIKKIIIFLFIFFSLSFSVFAEKIDNYEVKLEIQKDSSILVQENIDYNFESEYKHGIFRYIPIYFDVKGQERNDEKRKIKILNVKVFRDGQSENIEKLIEEDQNKKFMLQIGQKDFKITGNHKYTIEYKIEGGLKYFKDFDEIYWNAIGTGWKVPIEKAKVILSSEGDFLDFENKSCYQGKLNFNEKCEIKEWDKDLIFQSTRVLEPREGLTIAVSFDKNLIPKEEIWVKKEKEFTSEEKSFWLKIIGEILGFIIMIGGWFGYKWKNKYNPEHPVIPIYKPYKNFHPALTGYLIDQSFDSRDITAGILSLAQRGFLTIERVEEKRFLFGKNVDYIFRRTERVAEDELDKKFLDLIFNHSPIISIGDLFSGNFNSEIENEKNEKEVIKLSEFSDYSQELISDRKEIGDWLERYAKNNKILQDNEKLGVYIFIIIAILFVILFLVLPMVPMEFILILIFILFPIVFLSVYWLNNRKTKKGWDVENDLKGFKLFLEMTEKERIKYFNSPENNPQEFLEYLPYAVAFGVEKKWEKQFQGITIPQPDWYVGPGPFVAGKIMSDISDVSSAINTATSVNTTASSGSGSGGGGFSGGGFGGGGGGSW